MLFFLKLAYIKSFYFYFNFTSTSGSVLTNKSLLSIFHHTTDPLYLFHPPSSPFPSAEHCSVPFYSVLLRKPLTMCEMTTIVLRANCNPQITSDTHCPPPSSVQSLQENIAKGSGQSSSVVKAFEAGKVKVDAWTDINVLGGAEGAGLRKGGCETRPCKSDFTDTTSWPDQNQLCAKWLITVSLKYSRSCCLFLGWKKSNAEIWLSGFCSFYTLLIKQDTKLCLGLGWGMGFIS